jgi:hypothetical protein
MASALYGGEESTIWCRGSNRPYVHFPICLHIRMLNETQEYGGLSLNREK